MKKILIILCFIYLFLSACNTSQNKRYEAADKGVYLEDVYNFAYNPEGVTLTKIDNTNFDYKQGYYFTLNDLPKYDKESENNYRFNGNRIYFRITWDQFPFYLYSRNLTDSKDYAYLINAIKEVNFISLSEEEKASVPWLFIRMYIEDNEGNTDIYGFGNEMMLYHAKSLKDEEISKAEFYEVSDSPLDMEKEFHIAAYAFYYMNAELPMNYFGNTEEAFSEYFYPVVSFKGENFVITDKEKIAELAKCLYGKDENGQSSFFGNLETNSARFIKGKEIEKLCNENIKIALFSASNGVPEGDAVNKNFILIGENGKACCIKQTFYLSLGTYWYYYFFNDGILREGDYTFDYKALVDFIETLK